MIDSRQYWKVGLFVIISVCLIIGIWLWFSTSKLQSYNTYLTIFNEPVEGITVNSVVKYNGVEVGHVKSVELDEKNPRNIFVYLDILQNIGINENTYATLKSQGVTGLSYISLNLPLNAQSTVNIKPHNTPPYPKITTKPSFFYNLAAQAQSVTTNIQDASSQIKNFLSDQNINHLSNILSNLDNLSKTVTSRSTQIADGIDSMAEILENVKKSTERLNKIFNNIESLTVVVYKVADNANNLITNVQENVLQNVNAMIFPNLNKAITNLNQSSAQLEQFLILLNQNPSAIVRGKVPARPGPGE